MLQNISSNSEFDDSSDESLPGDERVSALEGRKQIVLQDIEPSQEVSNEYSPLRTSSRLTAFVCCCAETADILSPNLVGRF